MRVLDSVIFIEANKANFNQLVRRSTDIVYIVIHYTGNIGDSARNNALYFHEAAIQSSAHYFVSETDIYQSVPDNHAAYAVGLGKRKEPYFKYPTMWKKITNSNSISVELCGSKNSLEASEITKKTAAKLVADLCEKYHLTLQNVYRHYDVTGKQCPAWAVTDPLKWLDMRLLISRELYGTEENTMLDTPENYNLFKQWMNRYLAERDTLPADWDASAMTYAHGKGLINDGRPKAWITRGEFATVLQRLEK